MNAEQLCEYLNGIHWLSDIKFHPDADRIRWTGRHSGSKFITSIFDRTKLEYGFPSNIGYGRHPWTIVTSFKHYYDFKTRARKQFIADTISALSGAEYTVLNSWRSRRTDVIFTGKYSVACVTLGRRHIVYDHKRIDYKDLFETCRCGTPPLPVLCDIQSLQSAKSHCGRITRVLEQYKNEYPLLSEKVFIRMMGLRLQIFGTSIDINAPDFSHLRGIEERLQKLRALEMLPLPIAEEIAPHVL